jgi:hypothetical protein
MKPEPIPPLSFLVDERRIEQVNDASIAADVEMRRDFDMINRALGALDQFTTSAASGTRDERSRCFA